MPRPIRSIRKIRKIRNIPIPVKRGKPGILTEVDNMLQDHSNNVIVDHNGKVIVQIRNV